MMNPDSLRLTRRALLSGAGAGAAWAVVPPARADVAPPAQLRVDTRVLEVKGKAATVLGIVDADGRSGVNKIYDGHFRASLTNRLAEETLVHWHGLTPPVTQDGVPMLSGPALKPGETADYDFPTRDAGTHWMHSHMGLQEQMLLAAPLIIRESKSPLVDEQEHVVMLHDFTFRDPREILAELQAGGGGHAAHAGHGAMANGTMDHSTMDMASVAGMANDISFDAFLANDRTLDDPDVVRVEKGGRIRLRIINACAASNMWIDTGTLDAELIAVDGHSVQPVKGRRFPLAIAQRADIRLNLPQGAGAWPVLFKVEGSAGQAGIVLTAGGAAVTRISGLGEVQPALDLSMEYLLKPLGKLPETAVSKTEMVMLTGGGADYVWGLNGKASMHDVLFRVREGERYEIMFHNMTGMAHPMHLHGHYFKVVGLGMDRIDGALRDTILVPVGGIVTIQFDADNPGTWPLHCHHLYHMNAGMMGTLAYASAA